MTDLKTAAQRALEALMNSRPVAFEEDAVKLVRAHQEAIHALRAALAQPEHQSKSQTDTKVNLAEPVQEPVAWAGYDLDAMVEAFSRVIEAHHSNSHPFHNPIDMDARTALRILRGLVPAMKAYTPDAECVAAAAELRLLHSTNEQLRAQNTELDAACAKLETENEAADYLTTDGDALRLVKMRRMTVAWEPSRGGWSVGAIVDGEFRWLAFDEDCNRAIVRAAAEIGRSMK